MEQYKKKIVSLYELVKEVETLKLKGKTVVQSHGVYDLIHPGMIKHLNSAKKQGDILIVTVIKDKDVRRGPGRPIFPEKLRAENVASLSYVDYVSIVDDEIPFDEEAYRIWRDEVRLPEERIKAFGKKDNFWEMGEVGPCGPCSEIHYDLGTEFCRRQHEPEHRCEINGGCGRMVEIWNLVFIQFNRDEKGTLHLLPRRHVDTGAGFERIVRILSKSHSNFETPLFLPLIEKVEALSGVKYSPGEQGVPHRVAVDHIRMLAFALADGVIPSNEGRGYVVRRILRRAARFGREIGLETPFLYRLVDPLIEVMGQDFPEIKERYRHIVTLIKAEEEAFARTLGRGLELFSNLVYQLRSQGSHIIPGEEAFRLYDTYGFPLDLTELMARERGFVV
ncbi:MAG: alanine--tRNA ligase-related protein, partial [bacterium]